MVNKNGLDGPSAPNKNALDGPSAPNKNALDGPSVANKFEVDGPSAFNKFASDGVLTDRDMSMCLLRSDGTEEIDTSAPFTKSIDRLDLHNGIDLVSTFPLPQTPRGESPPSLEQSPSL
ncbi:hypothetical protein BJ742DRAFT_735512 [Cladochytrium replicatum]|nr:hypothetical protein BJ742DRAFT_735512 [Cladochytrium replicatum]